MRVCGTESEEKSRWILVTVRHLSTSSDHGATMLNHTELFSADFMTWRKLEKNQNEKDVINNRSFFKKNIATASGWMGNYSGICRLGRNFGFPRERPFFSGNKCPVQILHRPIKYRTYKLLLYCPAVFGHFFDPPGNHPRGAIFPTVDPS